MRLLRTIYCILPFLAAARVADAFTKKCKHTLLKYGPLSRTSNGEWKPLYRDRKVVSDIVTIKVDKKKPCQGIHKGGKNGMTKHMLKTKGYNNIRKYKTKRSKKCFNSGSMAAINMRGARDSDSLGSVLHMAGIGTFNNRSIKQSQHSKKFGKRRSGKYRIGKRRYGKSKLAKRFRKTKLGKRYNKIGKHYNNIGKRSGKNKIGKRYNKLGKSKYVKYSSASYDQKLSKLIHQRNQLKSMLKSQAVTEEMRALIKRYLSRLSRRIKFLSARVMLEHQRVELLRALSNPKLSPTMRHAFRQMMAAIDGKIRMASADMLSGAAKKSFAIRWKIRELKRMLKTKVNDKKSRKEMQRHLKKLQRQLKGLDKLKKLENQKIQITQMMEGGHVSPLMRNALKIQLKQINMSFHKATHKPKFIDPLTRRQRGLKKRQQQLAKMLRDPSLTLEMRKALKGQIAALNSRSRNLNKQKTYSHQMKEVQRMMNCGKVSPRMRKALQKQMSSLKKGLRKFRAPARRRGGKKKPMKRRGGKRRPMKRRGGKRRPVKRRGGKRRPVKRRGGKRRPIKRRGGKRRPIKRRGGKRRPAKRARKGVKKAGRKARRVIKKLKPKGRKLRKYRGKGKLSRKRCVGKKCKRSKKCVGKKCKRSKKCVGKKCKRCIGKKCKNLKKCVGKKCKKSKKCVGKKCKRCIGKKCKNLKKCVGKKCKTVR